MKLASTLTSSVVRRGFAYATIRDGDKRSSISIHAVLYMKNDGLVGSTASSARYLAVICSFISGAWLLGDRNDFPGLVCCRIHGRVRSLAFPKCSYHVGFPRLEAPVFP
jgi:hypothetical protein